jgi:hypothetical protein
MTFAEMVAEVAARGFDDMNDGTRLQRYVNDAFHELEEEEFWRTRENSANGVAPLGISDLGTIEMVVNSTGDPLMPFEWSELVEMFGDLSTTGTAFAYYTGTPSGTTEVATYPVDTTTITVQYWRVSSDLTGTNTPTTIPARFHKVIVNIAVREAYRDSDNHAAAESLQAQIDRDLAKMRKALLTDQVQGPSFIRIVHGSSDW